MDIGANIKILRKRQGKSQEEMAQNLGLNRSTYSGYENNIAQPNLENVVRMCAYFGLTVEDLITKDFASFGERDWRLLSEKAEARLKGHSLRVLASVVDIKRDEVVEVIPEKASAGYTAGFSDPDFFIDFPTLSLPFLSSNKKYRAFPIQGDSMPPINPGSIVVGEFVQDWTTLKSGDTCVFITQSEGIVFKKLKVLNDTSWLFLSSNPAYAPYELPLSELLEVWKFVCYVSRTIPDYQPDDHGVLKAIQHLQSDVKVLMQQQKPPNNG
ncbi:MAG: LexA family transcriptional regulator [Flavobacteriia bacterium]|nr:LexA family transcriptional regulator [Flavobacteriia bacterium]